MNPKLTTDQANQVHRAREVLAEDHGSDLVSMAARIGRLEFWLQDLVRLVETLTKQE